jgi:hypothetical protein
MNKEERPSTFMRRLTQQKKRRITGLFALHHPLGGSGYGFARSIALLIPTQNLRHILPALVFATQSPYSGGQNVVNSRDVMRNLSYNLLYKNKITY